MKATPLGIGPVAAGDLREEVQLQSLTDTRDDLNQPIKAWVNEGGRRPARVRVVRGAVIDAANQTKAPSNYEVRLRRGPLVTKLWRVVWHDPQYDTARNLAITDIIPLDTRDGVDLVCSEGLTNG